MIKSSFQEELEKKAGRAILTRSIYRWESAAIIALTMILAALPPVLGAAPLISGLVLGVGLLGEVGLVWSSVKDPEFRAKAVAEMFREKFNPREIKNKALRSRVEKALEYRARTDEVISRSREGILRDHMTDVSSGVTAWMENVFRLARRLDAYMADKIIQHDQRSVEPAIESLKKRLALEDDDMVKRQISQTIAQRQIQRDNLRKLQNVMERAQFQLESTITAMGTVYSQMMLLGSRDVASGRAQRLQQDISDQVQALQDVVTTMDEVYHASSDPLGLQSTASFAVGLGGGDLTAPNAPNAAAQSARKRLAGN